MALITRRECPRKAFIQENLPSASKSSSLHRVSKEVLRKLNYDPISSNAVIIRKACKEAFDEKAQKMLPFEAQSECERLTFLMERWVNWEKKLADWQLLGKELKETVYFAGETHEITIGALVKRCDHIEAIRYHYSAPALKYRGRTQNSIPARNPELLLLELAGEQAAAKMGINPTKIPVYASSFHFKGAGDTVKEMKIEFDCHPGDNVISYYFSPQERADLEAEFTGLKSDAQKTSCDIQNCKNCVCYDLCHTEFVPHKLEEAEDVELKKINEVRLTPNQQQFVEHDKGVLRVNAVAGSGKTTVVTLRTISLIEEGADPEKILMVTFTDKAKNEMKQRLLSYAEGEALIGEQIPVGKVQVETFNSWGQKLIEQNYAALGFTVAPELIDDVLKKDIIVELLEKHPGLSFDYRNPFMDTMAAEGAVTAMVKIIDALKSCHAETEDDVLAIGNRHIRNTTDAQEVLDMYNEYNRELVSRNVLDYEDQLRLLLNLEQLGLFRTMPYEHIVVDEFQDSDKNQIDVLVQLTKACKNVKSLVVVGDELQSIYGFRNSTPENLVTFEQYFPSMEDIPLEDNFRSETPIVALANHIIKSTAKIPKQIVTHNKAPGIDPLVYQCSKQEEEDTIFLTQIQDLISSGTAPSDIAVLCKTRNELIHFQQIFDQAGIPTLLRVPKVVGEEPYVKAIISLASFLKDYKNLQDYALYAKSLGEDPFDIKELQTSSDAIKQKIEDCKTEEEKIEVFFSLIKHCREDYVGDSFAASMERKGFHTIKDYISYCVKYRTYQTKETISSSREEADCVSLITVHSAKGLEWENIFLSIQKFKYTAEEERLLYVAVTRAKKRLVVTYTLKQYAFSHLLIPAV